MKLLKEDTSWDRGSRGASPHKPALYKSTNCSWNMGTESQYKTSPKDWQQT